jgi:acetyl-CoA acetyltransferase
MIAVRDQTAITGIGRTPVDRSRDADPMSHLSTALTAACADAGITRDDIDGFMVNLGPHEAAMDKGPELFGLRSIQWAFHSWFHGRLQPQCIGAAVWAVMSGQANYVACISTAQTLNEYGRGFTERGPEKLREGGGPHLESPTSGLVSVGGGAAMGWRKYVSKYGVDPDKLGAVAVAQRQWAQFQPEAYFHGSPITQEDYLASPYVVEPLRMLDHCLPGNAAFCIIVTTAERAHAGRSKPVYISGLQGARSGRETFIFARTGLGIAQQTDARYDAPEMPIYKMAGVSRDDVNLFGALDAFSPVVLFTLEEFGFCGEGEALDFVQDGRTAPGGEFPLNTCGGGLSDCESFGWGHTVDMVRQLRGDAGEAQVPGARVAQYATPDRASILLTTQ